mgnify:CR=1 FL=1|tara:strand:+ start:208803 stop:209321 length:519 start_codon:yes stop_codon:yes gene_type:complete
MSKNLDMSTWRLAAAYYGLNASELAYEDYQFPRGSFARVYLVPENWIQRESLPPRFFENFPESSGGPVGCVKTSLRGEDGHYTPCVIYNTNIVSKDWDDFVPEMDPLLYMLQDICMHGEPEDVVFFQSIENPWHIGLVRSCDPMEIEPLRWTAEDIGEIFGMSEGTREEIAD